MQGIALRLTPRDKLRTDVWLDTSYLRRFAETNVILDHRVRSDRDSSWVRPIEFAENDLVTRNLTKEILE